MQPYVYELPHWWTDCPDWWQHITAIVEEMIGQGRSMTPTINRLLSEFNITYDGFARLTAPSKEQLLLMVLKYS